MSASEVPASNRLRDLVWGNTFLPDRIFSYLELGRENGRASQVCKRWRVEVPAWYEKHPHLNLNWLFTTYASDGRCGQVSVRVLQQCKNLKSLTLPCAIINKPGPLSAHRGALLNRPAPVSTYRGMRYLPIFQYLYYQTELETLDLSRSYPYRFDQLVYFETMTFTSVPSLKRLITTGELTHWSIDQIARKFPGLEELQVNGAVDLEHLFTKFVSMKALSTLLIHNKQRTGFLPASATADSLAAIPENLALRRVSICHESASRYDSKLMKLLVMKMPNLDSLEVRSTSFEMDPMLDAIFAGADQENGRVECARFHKAQLDAIREKLKRVPNCFSADAQADLAKLFAPAKQMQQATPVQTLALDAPAGEKQQEGKKE